MGQVRLGLMHEILGTSPIAPLAFGNAAPDSGNSEILALSGTPEQKDRWLHPLLAGDLRSAFSMTEPGHARIGPDAADDPRRARRRRMGDQRTQVVLLQRVNRRLPDRDGGDQSGCHDPPSGPRCSSSRSTPPEWRSSATSRPWSTRGSIRRLRRPRGNPLRRRARRRGRAARRRGRGLRAGPAPARPGTHPPLHALARGRAAGLRHDVRARDLPPARTARYSPTSRRCRTGSPTAPPRCRPPG